MASSFVERVRRRAFWELHQARVIAKRTILDILFSRRRQQKLLARSERTGPSVSAKKGRRQAGFSFAAPVGIEPEFGYVVVGRFGVIEDSLPSSWMVRQREFRQYFSGVPSVRSLARRPAAPQVVETAISLRHPFEYNYFHALVDCVGALAQADEQGLVGAADVVVGKGFAGSKLFEILEGANVLGAGRWIVQDDTWVEASGHLHVFPQTVTPEGLDRLLRFVGPLVPQASIGRDLKLFLTRATGYGRRLTNDGAVRTIFESYGFDVVDPGQLEWPEQVGLFRRASHVAGVHGAAFTSTVFGRPDRLKVLEIESPGGNEDMFRRISVARGFDHSTLEGFGEPAAGNRSDFSIDLDDLEQVLDRWARDDSNPSPTPADE